MDERRPTSVCAIPIRACNYVIGRSYFGEVCAWPSKFYDGLNDAQRSVLEPPYANRLDRPNIRTDGTVEVTTRNDRKKQHDRNVFGTKYF